MPEDLSETIETLATGPASASGPAGSVSQPSIDQVIKADQHLAGKRAAQAAAGDGGFLRRAIRSAKVVPPSALGR